MDAVLINSISICIVAISTIFNSLAITRLARGANAKKRDREEFGTSDADYQRRIRLAQEFHRQTDK